MYLALKGCLEKYFIVPFEVAIDPLMATLQTAISDLERKSIEGLQSLKAKGKQFIVVVKVVFFW